MQKVQSGVVLNFEKTGPDPPPVGDGESQLGKRAFISVLLLHLLCCSVRSEVCFHHVSTAGGTKILFVEETRPIS